MGNTGHARNLPRQREAYLRLDVVEALSALRRGQFLCVFKDEEGRLLGLVRFGTSPDACVAILDGDVLCPGVRSWSGPDHLPLIANPNGVDRERRAARCPGCGGRCQVLVWIGSWHCRKCDRLLDRRQLVSRETLMAEELANLREATKHGRTKNQRQASFDRVLARQRELEDALRGKRPRQAAREHSRKIVGEWITIEEKDRRGDLTLFPVPTQETSLGELAESGTSPPGAPIVQDTPHRMDFSGLADRDEDFF